MGSVVLSRTAKMLCAGPGVLLLGLWTGGPAGVSGQQAGAAPDTTVAALAERLDSLRGVVQRLEAGRVEGDRDNVQLRSANAMLTSLLRRQMDVTDSIRAAQAPPVITAAWLRAFATVALIVVAYATTVALVWVLERLAEHARRGKGWYARAAPIAPIVVWGLAALAAVRWVWGIEAGALITAVAAGIVAVAFTAQDVLKNAFAGFVMAFDPPFRLGDKIEVGGRYGEVTSMGVFSTRIVTPDDSAVTVPNAQVVATQVSNANSGETNCQVVTDLYLPGWVDEAQAKRIAFEAAATSKFAYLDKPIVVIVRDVFKETFLTHLKVKAYVLHPRHEFLFMSDVTERARAGFRDAGLLPEMHPIHGYVDVKASSRAATPPSGANGEPER